jgi:hypothetical protein
LLIYESDDGDWSIADKSGQMNDFVEHLLAGCSQNSKGMKTFETEAFVLWQRQLHKDLTTTRNAAPARLLLAKKQSTTMAIRQILPSQ